MTTPGISLGPSSTTTGSGCGQSASEPSKQSAVPELHSTSVPSSQVIVTVPPRMISGSGSTISGTGSGSGVGSSTITSGSGYFSTTLASGILASSPLYETYGSAGAPHVFAT